MSQTPETYTVEITVERTTAGIISSSAVFGLHQLPREILDNLHLFTSPDYLEDVPEDEEVPQRGQQRPVTKTA